MSWPDATRVSNSEQHVAAACVHQPSPPPMHTSAIVASSYDARLAEIIAAVLTPGEHALVDFARKERELGEAFAVLPLLDRRALHTRLSNPKVGDPLPAKFARLTLNRRTRLIAFLGDARRRAAPPTNTRTK